jgi:hypothetical protein
MHLVEEEQQRAAAAIAAMRAAAEAARETHARAELMRHMRTTAAKNRDRPRDEAMRAVVDEWLQAWALERATWPHVGAMEALTCAFLDYVAAPSDASDRAVRAAVDAIAHAFAAAGKPLADQMAWRSMCAHGWWAQVRPAPAGQGRGDRAWPARPFWEEGCLPECL